MSHNDIIMRISTVVLTTGKTRGVQEINDIITCQLINRQLKREHYRWCIIHLCEIMTCIFHCLSTLISYSCLASSYWDVHYGDRILQSRLNYIPDSMMKSFSCVVIAKRCTISLKSYFGISCCQNQESLRKVITLWHFPSCNPLTSVIISILLEW